MMDPEDSAALERVIAVQGFDARTESSREVYLILDWVEGKSRRRYDLSLIFDGKQRGPTDILSDYEGSALCVGRGQVSVGVDDPVVTTFTRTLETGEKGVAPFLKRIQRASALPPSRSLPQTAIGPFSFRQQLYAADLLETPIVTLYGFRASWPVDEGLIKEECFLTLAGSAEEAMLHLSDSFRREHPEVDAGLVRVETDDMRLETVASGTSIFTSSRTSQLDERAYVEAFQIGDILDP